jgi:hypothetical protein
MSVALPGLAGEGPCLEVFVQETGKVGALPTHEIV